jgi:tetratricopeptide (TPR) repeat protein
MLLPALETLFVYDDPVGSEERLAILSHDPLVQANPAYHCELLTRLARSQGLQRRFEDAHATLDRALGLVCDDAACRVRVPMERGRVFNSSGDKATARPHFLEAFEVAVAAGLDELAVDAAHMMGIVEAGDASLDWNERAISIAEASPDPKAKRWFGSLYNNTAWTYHCSGNYLRALELFEKAKEYRTGQGDPKSIHIAEWCIARCLRSLGRLEDALEMQTRLHPNDEAGYVAEELGELLLELGRQEESRRWFSEAFGKLSQDAWLQANEPERLERMRRLSSAEG